MTQVALKDRQACLNKSDANAIHHLAIAKADAKEAQKRVGQVGNPRQESNENFRQNQKAGFGRFRPVSFPHTTKAREGQRLKLPWSRRPTLD